MTNTALNFAVFWGIWLLVPMLIDGVTYLLYLVGVWRIQWAVRRPRRESSAPLVPPFVTVIVPVYNGQDSLGACLASIRAQHYAQECLEILVVNNQSNDASFQVFTAEQSQPFNGTMSWVDIRQKGKVWALNTGIHLAHGSIVINVDCDTVVHPDAIAEIARAFEENPELAAATGAIEVQLPDDLPPWQRIWSGCEAMEYLAAFHIGRQYQTATDSLFTLAGAFSAFRREVLLETFLYDRQTVSEDTKMTLDVREKAAARQMRVGCVPGAVAFVAPTLSPSRLYAQRVRWQRGELEVAALQSDLEATNVFRATGLSIPRMLIIDHTMAFPRLIWTFLMPALYFLGYPLALVVQATIGLYFFYAAIEGLSMFTCYALGSAGGRQQVRENWYLWIVMPAYRFFLFWFRFGGFLNVLTDQAQWRVADPWEETEAAVRATATRVRGFWHRLFPPNEEPEIHARHY